MAEYIECKAAMTTPVLPKEYRQYQTDNLDDAYEQGWLDALDNLKNAPAVSVPQWISVKDRLPEPDENPVLAGNAELGIVNMAWYHRSKGIWETPSGFSCSFTHWMPLPEPPKGETMAEYIKRETVINHLDACMDTIWKPEIVALKCFVEGIPAADVVPVRHGRWQYNTDFYVWCCSECGKNPTKGTGVVTTAEKLPAYCPHCGAKMGDAE